MDVTEIRFSNIKLLAEKYTRERLADCDPRKKWTVNYINQLCGGFGSFGSATARKIEVGLDLPHGWMDQPQDRGNASPAPINAVWEQLSERDRELLMGYADLLLKK